MNSVQPDPDQAVESHTRCWREQIIQALADGKSKRVRKLLGRMHAAKIAALLEWLDARQRTAFWQQVDAALEGRILPHLNLHLRQRLAGESRDGEASDPVGTVAGGASNPQKINHLTAIRETLGQGKLKRMGKISQRMHPPKVAGMLEGLAPSERSQVWNMVDTESTGKVLTYLHNDICTTLACELDSGDFMASVQLLELDDLVDLIQTLPPAVGSQLMQATSGGRRQQLESMLSYPQDCAGGLMNMDTIEVRADVKVSTVLRYLRLRETLPCRHRPTC